MGTDRDPTRSDVDDLTVAPTPAARARVRTTVVIAIADNPTTARVVAAVRASPNLEIVATTGDRADVLGLARRFVPDVLIVGADLVASPGAGPADPVPDSPLPLAEPVEAAPTTTHGDAGTNPRREGPVTDLSHPVATGLRDLCGAVDTELPAVRIVVVAPEGVNSFGAVLGGAIGCIPPTELVERIVDDTRRVAWGEGLLTAEWARAVLDDLGKRASDRHDAGPLGRPVLTPTELEVLRRTANGATAADIASHHAVSVRDVNRSAASALVKAGRLHGDRAIAAPG